MDNEQLREESSPLAVLRSHARSCERCRAALVLSLESFCSQAHAALLPFVEDDADMRHMRPVVAVEAPREGLSSPPKGR